MVVVEVYAQALQNDENTNDALWEAFDEQAQKAIADGCRVLAMLSDSAWMEGDWQNISNNQLSIVPANNSEIALPAIRLSAFTLARRFTILIFRFCSGTNVHLTGEKNISAVNQQLPQSILDDIPRCEG